MDEKKLISLVEQNPVVFNVLHEHFTNGNYKAKVWSDIGAQFGTTGEICKEAWTKIRNRYLRVRGHRKLTNRQSQKVINKWKYEEEMDFYAKYLEERREILAVQPYISVARNFNRITGGNSLINHQDQLIANQQATHNDSQQISMEDNTEDSAKGFDECSDDEDERMPSEDDDVLKTFFDAMLETVSGFSDRSQHNAKAKIFSIVSKLEQEELNLKALMKT